MLFSKLLPKEGNFFELFDQHGKLIGEGARAFVALIQNYDDAVLRDKYAEAVVDAEHGADRVTAEVHRLLHRTFITPIDREQIHRLINTMDDVLDLLQDSTETMSLHDVRKLTPEVTRLAELAAKCCDRVAHVVTLLPSIGKVEVSEAAVRTCAEIDQLESDADRELRAALSRLFREQDDVRELIKLKAIYEQLESITDRCEDVADLIEGVVLEYS